MNKRGQVFLIAAIIFSIALYSVVIEYNTIKTYPGLEDYKDISDNYQTEYPKVINFALYNGTDPTQAADNFTGAFLGQARRIDPSFGVFYMYKDNEGNLHIVNTLNNKALKLQFMNTTGSQVSLTLLSADGPSNGTLCVNGISCSTESSFVGNFDTAYYKTNVTAPNNLGISILGEPAFFPVDITNFTSMTYLSSSEPTPLEGGPDSVAVSLQQY